MTATGFAFLLPALLRDRDSLLAATAGELALRPAGRCSSSRCVLTYCTGGRLRTRRDRVLLGGRGRRDRRARPALAGLRRDPATLLLALPDAGVAKVIDSVQRGLYSHSRSARRPSSPCAGARASAPGRRAMLPSIAGAVCLLLWAALLAVDLAMPAASVDPILLWGAACSIAHRAGGVPRGPAAVAAGAGRPGRPVRPARDDAARRAAGGAGAGAARPAVRRSPTRRRTAGSSTSTAAGRAARPAAGRSVARVQRDGTPVAALMYDRSLDDDPELVEAVGGAATIALENRLLQAQSEARLAELQASRAAPRHRGRRRAAADRAQPARRRPAAAGHAGPAAVADPAPHPRQPGRRRAARGQRERRARAVAGRAARARARDPPGRARAGAASRARGAGPALAGAARLVRRAGAALPRQVEFAAYFVASEALANVAKYARRVAR